MAPGGGPLAFPLLKEIPFHEPAHAVDKGSAVHLVGLFQIAFHDIKIKIRQEAGVDRGRQFQAVAILLRGQEIVGEDLDQPSADDPE